MWLFDPSAKDKTEKRLFGFSFTPLMDLHGTVLPDGHHHLLVYKCEEIQRLKNASYLKLPFSLKQLTVSGNSTSSLNLSSATGPPFQRNVKESVVVSFCLCSTKLTQNGTFLFVLGYVFVRQHYPFVYFKPTFFFKPTFVLFLGTFVIV